MIDAVVLKLWGAASLYKLFLETELFSSDHDHTSTISNIHMNCVKFIFYFILFFKDNGFHKLRSTIKALFKKSIPKISKMIAIFYQNDFV